MGNEDTDSVRHRVNIRQSISVCVFTVTNALYRLVSEGHGDEVAFILWSRNPGTKQFSLQCRI